MIFVEPKAVNQYCCGAEIVSAHGLAGSRSRICVFRKWRIPNGRITIRAYTGRGTTRAEDAQGTPTHSHISPSVLVYEENHNFCGAETVRAYSECAAARAVKSEDGGMVNGRAFV